MDEAIIKFYRRLLKEEFPNSGEIQHPTVFIEAVGEKLINCGNTGNYMQLYLRILGDTITEIKYLCSCEPVANVAVEVLCTLVTGKPIANALQLNEEHFFQFLGSSEEKFQEKVQGELQLLEEALGRLTSLENGEANSHMKESPNWDSTPTT